MIYEIIRSGRCATVSARGDDPHSVDDAWDITQQRQKNIKPEMHAQSDLEKNTKRREDDGENDTKNIHEAPFQICCTSHQRSRMLQVASFSDFAAMNDRDTILRRRMAEPMTVVRVLPVRCEGENEAAHDKSQSVSNDITHVLCP